jgi:hypothetical protein
MKLLADPNDPRADLWDAGRLLATPARIGFTLEGLRPHAPAALIFRVAPEQKARFEVHLGEQRLGAIQLEPGDDWQEVPLVIPAGERGGPQVVRLTPLSGGFALYHVWLTQRR